MPDLGQKHECFRCGLKFYDLKRTPVVCPKCGADQREAPPRETSPERLLAARRAKRDEFADPDIFDRGREEDDLGMEPEEPASKILSDEEELPLGEGATLDATESESDDEY